MRTRDDELETMKRLPINQVAAAFGYRVDRKKSSRHSAVMQSEAGDKIVCSTSRVDGHGVFFSIADNASGSVIDLVQKLTGGNLGQVRRELRPLLAPGALPNELDLSGGELRPVAPDLLGVLSRFSAFEPLDGAHGYLSKDRRIPGDLIASPRFAGRIRHDPARGGVIFPHYGSPDGSRDRVLTGYEIRGPDVNVFSKGGRKGLWPSNAFDEDERLCICEGSIDALSYAILRMDLAVTRFVSIGGQLNPEQPALITSAIERLPCGEVTLAIDNDEGGDLLSQKLLQIFERSGRSDLSVRVDVPETRGADWNQVLLDKSAAAPEPAS